MDREQIEKELDNMLNELNKRIKDDKMERDYTETKLTYKITTDGNMRVKIRNMSDNDMANAISSLTRRIEEDLEIPIGQVLAEIYLDREDVREARKDWMNSEGKPAKLKVTFTEGRTHIKVTNMPGWGLISILMNMITKGIEEFNIDKHFLISKVLKIDKEDKATRDAIMKATLSSDMDDILDTLDKMIDELKDKNPEKYSN